MKIDLANHVKSHLPLPEYLKSVKESYIKVILGRMVTVYYYLQGSLMFYSPKSQTTGLFLDKF